MRGGTSCQPSDVVAKGGRGAQGTSTRLAAVFARLQASWRWVLTGSRQNNSKKLQTTAKHQTVLEDGQRSVS